MSLDREVTPYQLQTMIDAVSNAANFEANHSCFDPRLNIVLEFLRAEVARREVPKVDEAELKAVLAGMTTHERLDMEAAVGMRECRLILAAAERSMEKP